MHKERKPIDNTRHRVRQRKLNLKLADSPSLDRLQACPGPIRCLPRQVGFVPELVRPLLLLGCVEASHLCGALSPGVALRADLLARCRLRSLERLALCAAPSGRANR